MLSIDPYTSDVTFKEIKRQFELCVNPETCSITIVIGPVTMSTVFLNYEEIIKSRDKNTKFILDLANEKECNLSNISYTPCDLDKDLPGYLTITTHSCGEGSIKIILQNESDRLYVARQLAKLFGLDDIEFQ